LLLVTITFPTSGNVKWWLFYFFFIIKLILNNASLLRHAGNSGVRPFWRGAALVLALQNLTAPFFFRSVKFVLLHSVALALGILQHSDAWLLGRSVASLLGHSDISYFAELSFFGIRRFANLWLSFALGVFASSLGYSGGQCVLLRVRCSTSFAIGCFGAPALLGDSGTW
jgi:hypothetical protein